MAETFIDLQVGDKVFRCMSGWGWHMRVMFVEKVHKLHIVVGGSKYRRDSGREAGSHYGYYLKAYSDTYLQEYLSHKADQEMRQVLDRFDWKVADIELVRTVHALLPNKSKEAANA